MNRGVDFTIKEKEKIRRIKDPLKIRVVLVLCFPLLVIMFSVFFGASWGYYIFYGLLLVSVLIIFALLSCCIQEPITIIIYDIIVVLYGVGLSVAVQLATNDEFKVLVHEKLILLTLLVFAIFFIIGMIRYFLVSKVNTYLQIENGFQIIEYMHERYSRKKGSQDDYENTGKILPIVIGVGGVAGRFLLGNKFLYKLSVYWWSLFVALAAYGMCLYLRKIYDYIKYIKSTGKKLYTEIYPFLERQKEINKKRRENGMRPIEIRSPFYR